MRIPITLALALTLAVAACGDDEPDTPPAARPTPQRPVVDTTIGDTVATPDDSAAAPGDTAATPGTDSARSPRPAAPDAGAAAEGGPRLYTVQVGAFVESETARSWERRLADQGLPAWVSIAELRGATYYRLRVGAVGTVAEARRLGRMITDRFEWPVWVAPLSPADRPPEGAVERSRRLLDAG